MAKIKSYTDIEQSKRLAKILPIESADMEWRNENIDNRIQYSSIEGAIKAHAKIYSFNIESELFPQLTKEQQKLWRKEIEQACISGGDAGKEYIIAKIKRLLTEWRSDSSTEAKYRHEAYVELLEWINKL